MSYEKGITAMYAEYQPMEGSAGNAGRDQSTK